jgi:hypothetical protein
LGAVDFIRYGPPPPYINSIIDTMKKPSNVGIVGDFGVEISIV